MRIGYSEEEEYPGQFDLWQANCRRSLNGKAGQVALKELEQALLALPEKRLIRDKLQNDEGSVCAVGALAKHKGAISPALCEQGEDDMEDVGMSLGMPRLVAWKVVCFNDEETDYMTPEQRYEAVLLWTQRLIREPETAEI